MTEWSFLYVEIWAVSELLLYTEVLSAGSLLTRNRREKCGCSTQQNTWPIIIWKVLLGLNSLHDWTINTLAPNPDFFYFIDYGKDLSPQFKIRKCSFYLFSCSIVSFITVNHWFGFQLNSSKVQDYQIKHFSRITSIVYRRDFRRFLESGLRSSSRRVWGRSSGSLPEKRLAIKANFVGCLWRASSSG